MKTRGKPSASLCCIWVGDGREGGELQANVSEKRKDVKRDPTGRSRERSKWAVQSLCCVSASLVLDFPEKRQKRLLRSAPWCCPACPSWAPAGTGCRLWARLTNRPAHIKKIKNGGIQIRGTWKKLRKCISQIVSRPWIVFKWELLPCIFFECGRSPWVSAGGCIGNLYASFYLLNVGPACQETV